MHESVVNLARQCDMDAGRLHEELTLMQQGYEHHLADLEAEPTTKEGNETLTALRNQVNRTQPDPVRIRKKLAEVEAMRVSGRTYPLIDCLLTERIINSDEISDSSLEQLRREVDHIIGQDRSRSTRGAGVNARDWLIIELVGIWRTLNGKEPDLSSKEGAFIDFAIRAADLIGVDGDPIPRRFERLREHIPDL